MDDFLAPYTLQWNSVVGDTTGLILVPDQRSPQAAQGHQHWFPRAGTYMLTMSWNGPESATLTTYTNGTWRNPLHIPSGTGERISAPHLYSGIGGSLRFAIVLNKSATKVHEAVVTVIPQESFKP